jgi:hypothetical protein
MGYYGGRCEVFGNPEKGDFLHHFDFSGMYSNRLNELFPYGEFKIITNPNDTSRPGIYCVSVFSDISLPILPYKDNNTFKLLFPNGNFYGAYT